MKEDDMQSKEEDNLIFIRLFPGEDIYHELEKVCQRHKVETAVVLSGVGQLKQFKVNYLDSKLCCYIPPHLEQLIGSLTTKTLVTICTGCYYNLRDKLQEKGDYRVRMLPEVMLEAVRGH